MDPSDADYVARSATFHDLQGQPRQRRTWWVATGTGRYTGLTGGGGIVTAKRPLDRTWKARLVGTVKTRGGAWQRVAVTISGTPNGTFVLTPLQRGYLTADSGPQGSGWSG